MNNGDFNKDANKYGWETKKAEHSHSYLLPTVSKYLKLKPTGNLLDIGTGNGVILPFWLSKGYSVSAMEPDLDGFNMAKENQNIDIRNLGVGVDLPLEWKEKFDVIVSLEVIEHLSNPYALVQSITHSLNKDGIAIISTPYHGYMKNLVLAIVNKWDFHHHPLRIGGHIKFWSKNTLTELFENLGYECIAFSGSGRLPFLWKSMFLVVKKK